MKFNKQINNGTLLIPGGAFKISGFEGGEKVEIHTLGQRGGRSEKSK